MNYVRRTQRGMTLIEVMVAIAIGLILMTVVAGGYNTYLTYQTNQITAEWLKVWKAGAKQWIADNSASLVASNGGTATYTQINTGGYFGTGFSATNSYGESATLKVIVGTGGKLQGLICAAGGQAPTGLQQRQIAGLVGLDGGWVLATAPTVAVGKSWGPVPLSTYGIASGGCQLVVALFVSDLASVTVDDYLHRSATPGHPELTQMSTAIDMANNDLNNGGTVNAKLLNLPGGNSINIGGSYLYGDGSNLATRSPTGGLYIQKLAGGPGSIVQVQDIVGSGTFTALNLSASSQVYSAGNVVAGGAVLATGGIFGSSVTSSGDVSAAGAVYASNWLRTYGNTGWYSQTYNGGFYMADATWVRSYADKSIYTGGQVQAGSIQSNDTIVANGRITAQEFVQINGVANAGWGCSPDGLIGRASDGTLLSCTSGVWKGGGGYSSFTIVNGPLVASTWSYATCPAGYTLLSGGGVIPSNPFATMPGYESMPINTTQWGVASTDNRVKMYAVAYCAK